ncbi:Ribokinase OS=Streptomyces tendae OX=1932 GN=rbsK PE=3 SV=1 [Streptomyces tendae]
MLLAKGPRSVVVTLGAEGALVASAAEGVAPVPSVKVAAVDTTGAGDAFTAALAGGSAPASRSPGRRRTRPGWARRRSRRRGRRSLTPTAAEADALEAGAL